MHATYAFRTVGPCHFLHNTGRCDVFRPGLHQSVRTTKPILWGGVAKKSVRPLSCRAGFGGDGIRISQRGVCLIRTIFGAAYAVVINRTTTTRSIFPPMPNIRQSFRQIPPGLCPYRRHTQYPPKCVYALHDLISHRVARRQRVVLTHNNVHFVNNRVPILHLLIAAMCAVRFQNFYIKAPPRRQARRWQRQSSRPTRPSVWYAFQQSRIFSFFDPVFGCKIHLGPWPSVCCTRYVLRVAPLFYRAAVISDSYFSLTVRTSAIKLFSQNQTTTARRQRCSTFLAVRFLRQSYLGLWPEF